MRVAVYRNNRDVRLEEQARPTVGPGELLMRVEASGICGSDVMEWYRVPKAPRVLGHEVAGSVMEVGPGVDRFRIGERIVATHHVPCNTCRYCLTDRHGVCETLRETHFDPGGFSEFVRLPSLNVDRGTFSIPDGVGADEASFVEPLACVIRAQRLAAIRPGQCVAILGSGVSGILHLQMARATGAGRIVATDPSDFRRGAARRYGADLVLRDDEDVAVGIREVNGDRLADRVLVCTAALPAIHQAFSCVDRGGTVLLFAPVAPGVRPPLPLHELWKEGINIVHSYAGPPAEMLQALELIHSNRIDVGSMVTHRLPLTRAQEGFDLVCRAADSLKVILDPRI